MKCPVCPDTTLMMSERQGVEIDYCPSCRGVWLDRGELDKLIALSQQASPPPAHMPAQMSHQAPAPSATPYAPPYPPAAAPGRRPDFEDSDYHKSHGSYRRKSWLSDLFD